jgi:DNA-binding Lrp family transcriptional regulator
MPPTAAVRNDRMLLATLDREILSALSQKIRVTTTMQLSRTWWEDTASGRESALRRTNRLIQAGFLEAFTLRVHPELPLGGPVWSWKPGASTPAFGVLSYRLRSRWTEPLRLTTLFAASRKGARLFGGSGGRLSHPLQGTHDLHVSAIYLRLFKHSPEEARGWVSENVLAPQRRRQKLPDAEIHDSQARVLKVFEFGGSYAPERVRLIHEDCERRKLPYELW